MRRWLHIGALGLVLVGSGTSARADEFPADQTAPMELDSPLDAPPVEDGLLPEHTPLPSEEAPAEEAVSTPESAPPESELAKPKRPRWESPYHSVRWPGTWLGLRASFGLGSASVPRFGTNGLNRAEASMSQMAPYLGLELGSVPIRWGGSLTVDATFLGSAASYLGQAPVHLSTSLNLIRVPRGSRIRWVGGFQPFVMYHLAYPTGQTLSLRGYGFRAGGHYLFKKWESSFMEGFLFLTFDRITEAAAGFDGNSKAYASSDFSESDILHSIFMVYLGIQFSLPW
ncbi:MAG: hypothetical protein IT285_00435 [Bdellovibrionales bacterium]|nr:hypothetical protein [Bdellovibrionales bacterium]